MPRRNKQIKHIVTSLQTTCLSKRRFNNEQSALKAADDQMLINMSLSLRVYKCDYCTGWHLTRNEG
jgi:hypothetical protein